MKLSSQSIIDDEKIKNYLLSERKRNDKSKWLATAGYSLNNWEKLKKDLFKQILSLEAIPIDKTKYGQMFEIRGTLKGPNGKVLKVHSIWMEEYEGKNTKFITMFPERHRGS
jgi:hypothetical protein